MSTRQIMRETGLKTISFSGIPRVRRQSSGLERNVDAGRSQAINNLGALRAHLEPEVASKLPTQPSR